MHKYVLHNGQIIPADSAVLKPGQVGLFSGWGVFTTLRVREGVLFAFEKHWARMKKDAELLRVPFPHDQEQIHRWLLDLVEANRAFSAAMRLIVVRNRGGLWEGPGLESDYDVLAFTADLKDWGETIRLTVKPRARYAAGAFAGTKSLSWAANLCLVEAAQESGYDEVILLNERDEVSECTSANIFIVQDSRVLTPPLSSGCLPGVTRQIILEEIKLPGIEIKEASLTLKDLEEADEIFITSTTRDLLSVREVAGIAKKFRTKIQPILQEAFVHYANSYVQRKKAEGWSADQRKYTPAGSSAN